MYTIAAIDDEVPAILVLEKMLSRYRNRPYRLLTARSGKEALRKWRDERVDVLLVDIEMPMMNGFAFVDALHKQQQHRMKTIMVTAYSQFAYCKQAISIRACDYLLKPVREHELLEAVDRALQELETEREQRAAKIQMQPMHAETERWLRQCVLSDAQDGTRERAQQALFAELRWLRYGCVFLRVLQAHTLSRDGDPVREVRACLPSSAQMTGSDYVFTACSQTEYALLVNVVDERQWQAVTQSLRELTERSANYQMGYSSIGEDWTRLCATLQQCRTAARQHLITTDKHVFELQQAQGGLDWRVVRRSILSVVDMVARGEERAGEQIRQLLTHTIWPDAEALRECLLLLLTRIQQLAHDQGMRCEPLAGLDEALSEADSREAVIVWTIRQAGQVRSYISHKQTDDAASNIQRVIAYLNSHYNEQISLNQAAAMAAVHVAYFCEVFKKQTGATYVEYVTSLRMKQAEQLLLRGSMPIGEIAQHVGYEDPNYFRRVFQRYSGMTPRQYRDGGST